MDDLDQQIDQPVDHPASAVHQIKRVKPQPPGIGMAAHLRRRLAIHPAAQAFNPCRIDPVQKIKRQGQALDEG